MIKELYVLGRFASIVNRFVLCLVRRRRRVQAVTIHKLFASISPHIFTEPIWIEVADIELKNVFIFLFFFVSLVFELHSYIYEHEEERWMKWQRNMEILLTPNTVTATICCITFSFFGFFFLWLFDKWGEGRKSVGFALESEKKHHFNKQLIKIKVLLNVPRHCTKIFY